MATRLHHATIRTSDLQSTLDFYRQLLDLSPGPRPPFDIPGAWLYAPGGDVAIVHVVEVSDGSDRSTGLFDHFAILHHGLADYLRRVKARGIPYLATPVDETNLVQVQHRDPNGIKVEVTFADEPIDPADIVMVDL